MIDDTACASNQMCPEGRSKDVPCHATGRKLKISLQKVNYLTLCEVKVQATVAESALPAAKIKTDKALEKREEKKKALEKLEEKKKEALEKRKRKNEEALEKLEEKKKEALEKRKRKNEEALEKLEEKKEELQAKRVALAAKKKLQEEARTLNTIKKLEERVNKTKREAVKAKNRKKIKKLEEKINITKKDHDEIPAWFPITEKKCWLAYCNAYTDLRAAFCEGKPCVGERISSLCKEHIYQSIIKKEGRLSADKRHLFPLDCGGVPTEKPTKRPTPRPTQKPTLAPSRQSKKPTKRPTPRPTQKPTLAPSRQSKAFEKREEKKDEATTLNTIKKLKEKVKKTKNEAVKARNRKIIKKLEEKVNITKKDDDEEKINKTKKDDDEDHNDSPEEADDEFDAALNLSKAAKEAEEKQTATDDQRFPGSLFWKFIGCKKDGDWVQPKGAVNLTFDDMKSCLTLCLDGGYTYGGFQCPRIPIFQVGCQCAQDVELSTVMGPCITKSDSCNGPNPFAGVDTGGATIGSVYSLNSPVNLTTVTTTTLTVDEGANESTTTTTTTQTETETTTTTTTSTTTITTSTRTETIFLDTTSVPTVTSTTSATTLTTTTSTTTLLELPYGWKVFFDERAVKPYFYDSITGQTTWIRPRGVTAYQNARIRLAIKKAAEKAKAAESNNADPPKELHRDPPPGGALGHSSLSEMQGSTIKRVTGGLPRRSGRHVFGGRKTPQAKRQAKISAEEAYPLDVQDETLIADSEKSEAKRQARRSAEEARTKEVVVEVASAKKHVKEIDAHIAALKIQEAAKENEVRGLKAKKAQKQKALKIVKAHNGVRPTSLLQAKPNLFDFLDTNNDQCISKPEFEKVTHGDWGIKDMIHLHLLPDVPG
eukprot:TRINITY_DN5543_c0_g1_i4.p1 TRINITY_DN5543_c0_g1~~TRINITY_DN5543_c0_g1_i4.p1  ORF type:complete len:984 (-),score=195.99 TRINITY_DN5543_c0_g1_i4:138-2777(-)